MFCTNGVLLRKLVGSGCLKLKEGVAASDESEEFSGLDATHVIVVSLLWIAFISKTLFYPHYRLLLLLGWRFFGVHDW